MKFSFRNDFEAITKRHDELLERENSPCRYNNGLIQRFENPVLTAEHIPLNWRYDFDLKSNPFCMERISFNAVMNSGAMKWGDKYLLFVRVEGSDRKSFFAIAESDNGIDGFRFWERPMIVPDMDPDETNIYDLRVVKHEDGWVYGTFCSEKLHPEAKNGDLSTASASTGIIRSKDLLEWERLPNLVSSSQQRNVVLHPEFIQGKYALYTRPQDDFISAGSGAGIGWTLIDDINHAVVKKEVIINKRHYHTVKEVKNGQGPAPIKTKFGWLHLAHGVRGTAAGLRYVLYAFLTDLKDPSRQIAEPAGYLLAPKGEERVGDVSNVVFCNGWIEDDDGTIYIYYASSDTRMHVAVSTVDRMLDYCFNTPEDGLRSASSVERICQLIDKNNKR